MSWFHAKTKNVIQGNTLDLSSGNAKLWLPSGIKCRSPRGHLRKGSHMLVNFWEWILKRWLSTEAPSLTASLPNVPEKADLKSKLMENPAKHNNPQDSHPSLFYWDLAPLWMECFYHNAGFKSSGEIPNVCARLSHSIREEECSATEQTFPRKSFKAQPGRGKDLIQKF